MNQIEYLNSFYNNLLRFCSKINNLVEIFIFLKKNYFINSLYIFFIRNLLNVNSIFKLRFKRLAKKEFSKIEKYLKKNRREYIRGYEYIRNRITQCSPYLKQYKIEGTLNLEGFSFYSKPETYPNFQKDLEKYKNLLIQLVKQKACKTFYKFGDGDYRFLKKMPIGSAAPGARALSKSFNEININEFFNGVLKNDYIMVDIKPYVRNMYHELFSEREIDFLGDFGHGLVANKWFFKTFKGKIGLIGAKEKLQLIEKLLKHKKYKEYLGIDKFNDYIYIPQKFACDNVNFVEKDVGEQLINSNSDIFLLGIGHIKSALLHRLKKYKKSIYMDIGGGIDAIAGVINIKRMYMGYWTNFQIKNYDYSKIDFLRYKGWGKTYFIS